MGPLRKYDRMIIAAKAAAATSVGLPYRWVAVGGGGELSTSESTTASSWTARTSSFGTTAIYGIGTDKLNYFVAVGASGKLATSPDGITWTQRTSGFGTTGVWCVGYGNGYWIAGGQAFGVTNHITYATDPTGTWTAKNIGASGTETCRSVVYANGIWCALLSNGDIRTATDPTGTWTLRTSTLAKGGPGPNAIIWWSNQSLFIAGLDSGGLPSNVLATSPDGITWTARSLPNGPVTGDVAFVANSTVAACVYSKTGPLLDIATSTDGTSWTDRTPASTSSTTYCAAVDSSDLMVVGGLANALQTSTDGTTWTSRTGPTFAQTDIINPSGGTQ